MIDDHHLARSAAPRRHPRRREPPDEGGDGGVHMDNVEALGAEQPDQGAVSGKMIEGRQSP